MGRKQKRGKAGNAAQYLTRTQAVRKLQLRLGEFRRLCILKGIHPREPKKKVHGANKTYYHLKDINFLLHEPLLQMFRNIKAYDRKIRKAKAKLNSDLAQRLQSVKPGYKVDHLVKERYPSFVDAIRDLDDPLTMVNLFATLPAEKKYAIPAKAVSMARRLSMEFNAYVVRTHALRKVFVSIKGFYYQAEILGQAVTWLVPHQLAQVLPVDVDYRVMLTFLEFYSTMLQFVNFKLYHMIELRYPPSLDSRMEAAAEELAAIMKDLAGVKGAVDQQIQEQQQQLQQLEQEEAAKRLQRAKGTGAKPAGAADGAAAAVAANGSEDDDVQSEDFDSEDDGQDGEGDDAALEIDSGDEEEEEEEEEEEDEEDEEEEAGASGAAGPKGRVQEEEEDDVLALMAARRNNGRKASTSTAAADDDEDDEGCRAAGGALGVDASDEAALCGSLFKGLVFFLAREVPREPLLLVVRAFGGIVAWDGEGSPMKENDEGITHQVVDRPTQGHRFLSRKYVQPQWVLDSANFRVLMPCELYVPGKVPPPHLSPFVDNDEEGYTPDFAVTVKALQEAAKAARLRVCGTSRADDGAFVAEGEDAALALAGGTDAAAADDAEAAEQTYVEELQKELRRASGAGEEEEDEGEGDEGEERSEQEEEEEPAAASGRKAAAATAPASRKRAAAAEAEREETERMKDIMMTRKNRKLYERIKRAQEGKRSRVEVLEERKRALEAQQQQQRRQQQKAPAPAPAKQKAGSKRKAAS